MAAALALSVVACAAQAADNDNPYKNVKVGDYASYKATIKFNGTPIVGGFTQTVTAKNDKEATIEVRFTLAGMQSPAEKQTVDLTKPYDPTSIGLPQVSNATVKKLQEGKEDKVAAAGKMYNTSWTTYNVKAKTAGTDIAFNPVKVWMSPDAPMGVVKMEATGDIGGAKIEITMELAETGTTKKQ